jgi:glucose/arabinose dehydrogenase
MRLTFLVSLLLSTGANAADLPKAPDGWTIRELARMPENPTRIADDGSGKRLFVLLRHGDVYQIDLPDGQPRKILSGTSYAGANVQDTDVVGLAIDKQRRFYIVVNQKDTTAQIWLNRVTIFRSAPMQPDAPLLVQPWLVTQYPFGVDVFNHGVGHIAFGPDGFAYVASGSRTDSNEPGSDPHISREGETPITSCIWRLDPNTDHPQIEIFADGLRNPYGFCWDDRGRMVATDNGPNEDPPEELNIIEKGKHYGFPYQFSDWAKSPYPHTQKAPAGMTLELPIINIGPDAGGTASKPIATFDPHSSPTGIVYLGNDLPEKDRGTFLVPRFGPLLAKPEVGFDVLQVRLHPPRADGRIEAEVKRWLAPAARPVDIHLCKRRVYLCEFSSGATSLSKPIEAPGRVLELTPIR